MIASGAGLALLCLNDKASTVLLGLHCFAWNIKASAAGFAVICLEDKASTVLLGLHCFALKIKPALLHLHCSAWRKEKEKKERKKKKKKPALLGEKGHDDHLSREGLFGKHSISNKGFDDQHSQKALLISRGRKACGNFW